MDGRLYVCGGFDGMTSLDTVECYTKTSNKSVPSILYYTL